MIGTSWHSYAKIYNLGHAALKELFEDDVIIEEKMDGSQFSFGIFDGELRARSKGKEIVLDAPEKMFNKAIESIKAIQHLLIDGWTYRGEYLQSPSHNALTYDRIPVNNIIIFDIATAEEQYLDYDAKKAEATRIGLETVPLIYQGKVHDVESFKEIIDRVSILGGQKIEGVVVKNYKKFGPDKKVLLGKHVSESFREVHAKVWGESNPGKTDMLGFLGHKYKTHARWNKAIQHLKEAGNLTDSPKDIGNLMKEVQKDIEVECLPQIIEELLKWALPHIKREAIKGLPEWYKEQLMNKQFETDTVVLEKVSNE